MITAIFAALTFGACTLTRRYLRRRETKRTCAGGYVRIQALWNDKGAFGLPFNPRSLAGVSAVLLAAVWLLRRQSPVGAGLVFGGGMSNLLERLQWGRVYDYLRFPRVPGRLKRYVWNLADAAIFLGTVCMLLGRKKS